MKRSQRRTRANLTKMQQAEVFEERQMLSAVSASIDSADSAAAATDGTGNNADNAEWGSTDIELLRLTTVEYADGVSSPAGTDLPSGREVSNAVIAQDESTPNDRNLTDIVWIWGQFIDHDIDLSEVLIPLNHSTLKYRWVMLTLILSLLAQPKFFLVGQTMLKAMSPAMVCVSS